jgi:hypothetical protein
MIELVKDLFKSPWAKIYWILLTLNAVVYLLFQAVYPGNMFTVPTIAQPFVIALYALWWLVVIWLSHAVMALTKTWRWRRALGLSIIWAVGLLIGTAVCPADKELITASIMSFGIGSSFGWAGAGVIVSLLGLW